MPRRAFAFVLPLLLVAGCGGGGEPGIPAIDYPALGGSAMDLTLGGVQTQVLTMKGTGRTLGEVTVVTPTGDGVSAIRVQVALPSTKVASDGTRLTQKLTLHLNVPATLTAGATYTIDGTTNAGEYEELRTYVRGAFYGDGFGQAWRAAGGTVEVVSISGGAATLRLTGVVVELQGLVDPGSFPPYTISGTLTGPIVAAFDDGVA